VADTANNPFQKFESDGTSITKWGSEGSADGQFKFPRGLATKSANVIFQEERVFVADLDNNRIQIFGPELVVHP
jgi:tripartite motif-containing protein 71